ncbi:ESF1 homolog isoform X1 [Latimeria chalumnae]|uniref:ESF1 nucleolar pre-rRNA processing protein homolog n=1 Tax=Latimeria chalumnae TaxID=7897 RepID=H3B9U7_LATCH|nr:PREDICTED: ESF1 homolog isoform X1 [Latimeria chalumnae]XP_014343333.1 PREDICTED: ESF1 homolog isoform X1 [Latimeria chalumnae]|eukprot:XP_014343331.1 PREDICTED: ESF1 homolog isoform X1 [Latimeria chalumnae]
MSKGDLASDQRFSRVMKDPRFWEMPEKERKIKIDKRFQAMFHDKKFKLKYTVDKRGRPINHSTTEDLKRFYDLSDSGNSDLSDFESKKVPKKDKKKKLKAKEKVSSQKEPLDLPVEDFLKEEENSELVKSIKKADQKVSREKLENKGQLKAKKLEREGLSTKVDLARDNNKKLLQGNQSKGDDLDSVDRSEVSHKSKQKPKGVSTQSTDFTQKRKLLGKRQSVNKMKPSEKMDEALEEDEGDSESEDDSDICEGSSSAGDLSEGRSSEEEDGESGSSGEEDSEEDDEESEEESDSGPDLARGKGNIETSSEEEEEDDMMELFQQESQIEHNWGEMDKDAPRGDMVTHRLAVCNMDWDRLKARDLLALLNSFKPKGGVVFSVKIYPSEFGKERMKAEELQGPTELRTLPEDANQDTEEERTLREKMRDYQFKRLKYFYAVVDCDSPETASKIYEECDGLEFESSCSFVDLRFVPDDVTFNDKPKDVATEVDTAAYKPKYFTSAAMGTSKVEVTWDETDHERVTTLSRDFKKDDIFEMDFQAYLASSSEEEEEEEPLPAESLEVAVEEEQNQSKKSHKNAEDQISKYKELLKSIQEKEKKYEEKDMEMKVTWVPGLKESAEKMVKKKLEGKDKLTPWKQFLEKKKQKKKQKKKPQSNEMADAEEGMSDEELPPDVDLDDPYFADELGKPGQRKKSKSNRKEETTPDNEDELERQKAEMALLMMDDEEEDRKHFHYDKIVEQQNMSKKKRKRLLKRQELLEEDQFEMNVADPRFQAMYTSHLFNLDPSDSNFKKTTAMQRILEEKARRREQQHQEQAEAIKRTERELGEEEKQQQTSKKSTDPSLSMLIKSVKSKTQQFQARKKQKVT